MQDSWISCTSYRQHIVGTCVLAVENRGEWVKAHNPTFSSLFWYQALAGSPVKGHSMIQSTRTGPEGYHLWALLKRRWSLPRALNKYCNNLSLRYTPTIWYFLAFKSQLLHRATQHSKQATHSACRIVCTKALSFLKPGRALACFTYMPLSSQAIARLNKNIYNIWLYTLLILVLSSQACSLSPCNACDHANFSCRSASSPPDLTILLDFENGFPVC